MTDKFVDQSRIQRKDIDIFVNFADLKVRMPEIKQFILDRLQIEYSLPADIDVETFNYVEAGYIDSMGMIRFIAEIEDAFKIEFSDEELTSPSFKTIGTLVEMVRGKVSR